ncbi:hypothetical protein HMN09_01224000 [Mycena chlorophos]|uniref:Xylanolytic transcriptional activator regulatory domain-containing protein n=1 Tax=Mycena chlorophos TaxID=658473 RepID=A0A8H6S3U0_MYCCL|nr:hypothetical protein HMN09_01224000 [Mycena chlorophos]
MTSLPSSPIKLENDNHDIFPASPRFELGSALSSIVLSWEPPTRRLPPESTVDVEEYRALDSDADDDFEPHYVGETAERDGLVLSALASVHSARGGTPPRGNPFRVRQVSTSQSEPVFFLFERVRPYGEDSVGKYTSAELIGLLGPSNIHRLLQHYLRLDGIAVPIWRSSDFTDNPEQRLPAGLFCAPGKFLSPLLLSIDFPQTIAAGRLMGLHLDCTSWLIPRWEKQLRIKLWWAVLQQDKWSALCYGRSSYVHYGDWDVPLPPCDHPNDFPFVALCELTVILDRALRELHVVRQTQRSRDTRDILRKISMFGVELDTWKHRLDSMDNSLNGYYPPGFRSLQLSHLAVALLLVRCVLDLELPPSAAASTYDSAIRVTEEVVAFTSSLTPDDLRGYFTTYSAFHFSTCLVLLIRLVLSADPSDQSDGAPWQRILHLLRIFISALSEAKKSVPSFELGDLALARARHLIPLLAKNSPALSMALEPLFPAQEEPMSPTEMSTSSSVTSPTVGPAGYHAHPVHQGHPHAWTDNNGAGLDAFFPEVTQPDWAAFRDYVQPPFAMVVPNSYGLQ